MLIVYDYRQDFLITNINAPIRDQVQAVPAKQIQLPASSILYPAATSTNPASFKQIHAGNTSRCF